jgi:hypothetical protein
MKIVDVFCGCGCAVVGMFILFDDILRACFEPTLLKKLLK